MNKIPIVPHFYGCIRAKRLENILFIWMLSFWSVSLESGSIVVIYPFCTRHIQTIQCILCSFLLGFSNKHDMTWHGGRKLLVLVFYFLSYFHILLLTSTSLTYNNNQILWYRFSKCKIVYRCDDDRIRLAQNDGQLHRITFTLPC